MTLHINRHTLFSTALNILGLTLAFSIFLILMVQVIYDFTYDRNYRDHDKIVRFEFSDPTNPGIYDVSISRPIILALKDFFPQAEAVSCYRYYKGSRNDFMRWNPETSGTSEASAISLTYALSDYDLLNVFPFEFTQGDTSQYSAPWTAILTESAARKLFGDESPVGKSLCLATKDGTSSPYQVVATYKDFPENTSIDSDLILNIGNSSIDNYSEWSYHCYMKMSNFDGLEPLIDSLKVEFYGDEFKDHGAIRLSHLHDAYFAQDIDGDKMGKGNRGTTFTLLTVSILVILLAIINFVNFSMASVPFIIKSINTRRVLGSSRGAQIANQLLHTLIIVLIAFVLSLCVLSLVASSSMASHISGSLKVADNLGLILAGAVIAIVITCLAGLIPARYSTSFNPAMVLKGAFSLSDRGRTMRSMLVGFQYVVSFLLIICSLFITVQINYMKRHDMGFNREHVVTFWLNDNLGSSRETLKQMLLENPRIKAVTFAGGDLVSTYKMGWGHIYEGQRVQMDCLPVDPDFLSFFGLQIKEGRDFTDSDRLSSSGNFIVNESFMRKYPFLRVGLKCNGHKGDNNPAEIIGIVRDFNFKPMQYGIEPLALYNFGADPWWPLTVGYARIDPGNVQETFQYFRDKCTELDPSFNAADMGPEFLDDSIGALYSKEENLNHLIIVAAIISLIISIIGILGLVHFETQFRKKEIALRRVHGAQVMEILRMINRHYLQLTLLCFVLAVPPAIAVIRVWVGNFTYQSPVPVWIFMVSFAVIAIITFISVTLQSFRTATLNPIKSISNE